MNFHRNERLLDSIYAVALLLRDVQRFVLRPVDVGARVLIVRDNQVLLIRHRGGSPLWSLPGGGVQRSETLVEAARREAREETGCDVRVDALLGMFHQLSNHYSDHIAVFICTALSEPQPRQGDLEIRAVRFFDMHTLTADIEASTARRIAEYRRGETCIYREW